MARVSVEVVALLDRRFAALGKTLGFDRFAALGRMVYVWHTCQEEERHHLTEQELDDIHPDLAHFGAAVRDAGLAREENGLLYIVGTKGRIEWLAARRAEGKRGGRPKNPVDNPTVNPTDNPRDCRKNNPPTPTPTPTPTDNQKSKRARRAAKADAPPDHRVTPLGNAISQMYLNATGLPLGCEPQMRRDIKKWLSVGKEPSAILASYRDFLNCTDKFYSDHKWGKFEGWWNEQSSVKPGPTFISPEYRGSCDDIFGAEVPDGVRVGD